MRSRLFPSLALTTALLTVGLIVFGAVVRVTDSGLGCGNHWPLCNGTIFPPLDNLTAWIEWLHRLFALLIGIFGVLSLIVAVRDFRKQRRGALYATILAAFLYAAQAGLGAAVVLNDLTPALVTLHLATAMLLLASLIVAALIATYTPDQHYARDNFTVLAYVTAALALVIILTGALVRGSGATLACVDWPLCNGAVLPVQSRRAANDSHAAPLRGRGAGGFAHPPDLVGVDAPQRAHSHVGGAGARVLPLSSRCWRVGRLQWRGCALVGGARRFCGGDVGGVGDS